MNGKPTMMNFNPVSNVFYVNIVLIFALFFLFLTLIFSVYLVVRTFKEAKLKRDKSEVFDKASGEAHSDTVDRGKLRILVDNHLDKMYETIPDEYREQITNEGIKQRLSSSNVSRSSVGSFRSARSRSNSSICTDIMIQKIISPDSIIQQFDEEEDNRDGVWVFSHNGLRLRRSSSRLSVPSCSRRGSEQSRLNSISEDYHKKEIYI